LTIPSNYKDLSGFKTSYSETELRIAIAVAEVLIANNLGGGGSGGSGITQSEVTSAINAATNVDAIELDADAILAILNSGVSTRALARTQSPTATGIVNTSGDNTIIAAPGAGQRIYITKLQIQLEASTATTVLIRSGATAIGRIRCVADGDGKIETYSPGFERRLGVNEALIFNLSGANSVGFEVEYYTGS
jgi:hypothetical protein